MDAKLIKVDNGWVLMVNNIMYATDENAPYTRLSVKNCEAIVNGYDLDELAEKACPDVISSAHSAYKAGFQKALEILGDKKYSEEDMLKSFSIGVFTEKEKGNHTFEYEEYIQSLQQTEWDIEIEMICPHPMDTYRCGLKYGCDGDGCNHPEQVPYLDADGCLILRKI